MVAGVEKFSVTTENASEMTNDISQLYILLDNSYASSCSSQSLFRVRCFAHVFNLALKERIKIVHSEMDGARYTMNVLHESTRLLIAFEAVV